MNTVRQPSPMNPDEIARLHRWMLAHTRDRAGFTYSQACVWAVANLKYADVTEVNRVVDREIQRLRRAKKIGFTRTVDGVRKTNGRAPVWNATGG